MAEKGKYDPIVPLYGVPIHEAIASGDLGRMKQLAQEAEQYLHQAGDVPAALQALKIEIAKAEHKK
jgi:hypothetical protein